MIESIARSSCILVSRVAVCVDLVLKTSFCSRRGLSTLDVFLPLVE